MRRLIIFLIRKRLGLKKYEPFRFTNQKSNDVYYFTSNGLTKRFIFKCKPYGIEMSSGVSLNWILDDNCEVKKLDEEEYQYYGQYNQEN